MSEQKEKPSLYKLAKETFSLCTSLEDFHWELEDVNVEDSEEGLTTDEAMYELSKLLSEVHEVKNTASDTKHPAIVEGQQFEYDMFYNDDCPVDLMYLLDILIERLITTLSNAKCAKQVQNYRHGIAHTKVEEFDDKKQKDIENSIPLSGKMKFIHSKKDGFVETKLHPDCLIPPLKRVWLDFSQDTSLTNGGESFHIESLLEHLRLAGSFIAGLHIRENDSDNTEEKRGGIKVEEANIKVLEIIKRESHKGREAVEAITVRKLAKEIECSNGTIHKCMAYKELAATKKKNKGKKPSTVRLTENLQSVMADSRIKTPDEIVAEEELAELVKQQQADQRKDELQKTKGVRPKP